MTRAGIYRSPNAEVSMLILSQKHIYWVLLPVPSAALFESEPAGRIVSPPCLMFPLTSLSPPRSAAAMLTLSSGPPTPSKSPALESLIETPSQH